MCLSQVLVGLILEVGRFGFHIFGLAWAGLGLSWLAWVCLPHHLVSIYVSQHYIIILPVVADVNDDYQEMLMLQTNVRASVTPLCFWISHH